MTSYPRETVELIPVTVTVNGAPVTTGVQLCVTPDGARPTVWEAPYELDGRIGYMLDGTLQGDKAYRVWAKVTDTPEIPVIDCGSFYLS